MKIIKGLARTTDPETSHEATADLTEDTRTERQQAVLKVLRSIGASTDEWLVYCYPAHAREMGLPQQSASGIRTRRNELVIKGLVEWNGRKQLTSSGRRARVWRAL